MAIETDETLEHPRHTVIEPVRAFDSASITDWAERRLAPEAEAFSDGLGAFRRFADTDHAHTVLESAGGRTATEVRGRAGSTSFSPTSSAPSMASTMRSNSAATPVAT